ncbi:MAG: paraquat-inducible protein A [Flavobacteriales bacterium]|nr:paraquat-inducible protein A [Flavobacteriales bacterium]
MYKKLRSVLLVLLALALTVCSLLVHNVEQRSHQLKADEMELSSINYGLFNPDRWKDAIKAIVAQEIITFKIEGKDRVVVKEQLEKAMRQVLDELRRTVDDHDHGVKGTLRKAVMNAVVPMDAIRADIPEYAESVLDELDKPANREKLKGFALDQLDSLAAETSGKIDMHLHDRIMARYGFTDPKAGIASLRHDRAVLENTRTAYGWAILGLIVLMVVLMLIREAPRKLDLAVLLLSATVLLVTALLMPMIDIEARITSFKLVVLGGPITFSDQVLFYESRSILQVIWLLLEDRDPALMLVAVLVFCFSVAFPFTKLILSFTSVLRNKLPKSKVLRFFVLKSAKWSMADVLVVAMFMTYLGFNGLVNSQLAQLRDLSSSIHIMTTNRSALELGFYLFTGFVLLGLVISALMERALKPEK